MTYDLWRCALISIVYRDVDFSAQYAEGGSPVFEARFRRLLFQGLREGSSGMNVGIQQQQSGRETRTPEDDDYIWDALSLIQKHNYWKIPEDPKFRNRGPPLPSPSIFANPRSADTSGFVSERDMRVLVKLLVALQLSPEGVGIETFADKGEQLDGVCRHVLAMFKFSNMQSGERGVGWEEFETALIDYLVRMSIFLRYFEGFPNFS